MIELERTFLASSLPLGLKEAPSKELLDIYIPASSDHPNLRIRRRGGVYEITKKTHIAQGDASQQAEDTIKLNIAEFEELTQILGKRVRKLRYFYPYNGKTLEIDLFQDDLSGLVLIDAEFESEAEMNQFVPPVFCLIEVTQEEFLAGGMLCGKTYDDIAADLNKYEYKPLYIQNDNK